MIHIKSFSLFQERLGIIESIDEIAESILQGLSKDRFFTWTGIYLDKNITINCKLDKLKEFNKDLLGGFKVEDAQNFIFSITIDKLDKTTIKHELKHMDRTIRRNMKTDTYYYINHIGRYVANEYPHLFNKDCAEILIDTFYFCNPDEFEAHFGDIYEDTKNLIDSDMTREEKMSIVKESLEGERIWQLYKYYYDNNFDLSNFFKSNEDCNFFIKEFFYRQDIFFSGDDYSITKFDKVRSWFKSNILNKMSGDVELDTGGIKQINYYINKIVRNNYPKFSRLYTLLV